MTTELMTKSLRDNRGNTIGWGIALVASVALQLAVYPAVRDAAGEFEKLLESYPESFKALFNIQQSLASGVGYLQGEVFGFLAPLVLLGIAIGQAARATAGEEKAHTLDLLLANPISRTRLLLDKAISVLVSVAIVTVVFAVVLVVGNSVVGLGVPWLDLVLAVKASAVVALPFGALALLIGALTGRPGLAIAVPVGLALLTYLLDALSALSDGLRPWRVLSPFHHAAVNSALSGDPNWLGLAGLVALTAVLVAAAAMAFERREVRG
ncbi:ABC-2 type transport system permease protein [Lentzea waywayandensis]|uniref:ABC-2 type transport system permease protein n=1 Tax=Lentzea waywayandensis TaxID=84724 RepID=A0A1I6D9Q0_9PSEU|nr:ABC transporter permease subunit [Lentzea waywayandensis]SFR02091.1 ABC-2 type transport system permease protein [Lentzea waywayandensis]